MDLHK